MLLRKKWILVILTVLTVSVWYGAFSVPSASEGLSVYVFDVGQGDSIFIETVSGNQILIDGGPTDAVLAQLGRVMSSYDRSIDMLILTHPDADHLNGLVDVIGRYEIGTVVETGVLHETEEYKVWHERIGEKEIPVIYAHAGQEFLLDKHVTLKILAPFYEQAGKEVKKINNTSVVARLDYGESSLLLTGDIESSEERKLVILSESLDTDILKVGHHGSKTSSSDIFLEKISPMVALVSVGRNSRYGHPHQEVLNALKREHVEVHRTDMEGTLLLRMYEDGTYSINGY
ncbi:MAG: hypothetical protein COU90_00745 [Candidatus Ryanbacteria bacterium CG10_big_fil_rev_8_21_14_0_10_43_42]|uniref:Metallo-beta-lactamase domain-containing protein n=1 Tax=Candidatus Ryanbacteria bacterium CG10_big_fil_rev_8_21_14_0_10_43_42 TaxID=1974864 RepID=A0A2M8KXY2_9BACT|nr:MAG: hypothetical protein COU90_00745 [Candidatus Ryanbacteria bacterium CG10_big_fil_rev_8_21_14_0_10_43_42]